MPFHQAEYVVRFPVSCLGLNRTKADPYNVTVLTNHTSTLAKHTSTVTVLESSFRHGLAFEPIGKFLLYQNYYPLKGRTDWYIVPACIFVLLLFSVFSRFREMMIAIAFWISVPATILTLISLVLNSITVVSVGKGMGNLPGEVVPQTIPGIGRFFSFSKSLVPVAKNLMSEHLGLWLNVVTVCLMILAAIMQWRLNHIVNREKLRSTSIIVEHK